MRTLLRVKFDDKLLVDVEVNLLTLRKSKMCIRDRYQSDVLTIDVVERLHASILAGIAQLLFNAKKLIVLGNTVRTARRRSTTSIVRTSD